jgi:DNA polymerase I
VSEPAKYLYLIDGYAQFFRAFHAIRTPMSSPVTKEPTNMTFGFLGMLLKLLRGEGALGGKPAYVAVAIDVSGDKETFRSTIYPEYKANRTEPPSDLLPQIDRCLKILEKIGIPVLGLEGYEADDVIASVVRQAGETNIRIVSKDKDLKQLLREGNGTRGSVELFDVPTDTLINVQQLHAETGLKPEQVVDMLSLMGDNVDNVPGVEGVGPKTACELVATYGTAAAAIEAAKAGKIKGKRGEKLAAAGDVVELARKLVVLDADTPVTLDLEACRAERFDLEVLIPLCKELGFNRFQEEVRQLLGLPREGGDEVPRNTESRGAKVSGGAVSSPTADGASSVPTKVPSRGKKPVADNGPGLFGGDEGGGLFGDQVQDSAGSLVLSQAQLQAYRCVKSRNDLAELIAELKQASIIAFDTETTGLSPRQSLLCGISFSTRVGSGWYVPVRSPRPEEHLDERTVLDALRPILEDASKAKCGHNVKFDLLVLRQAGVKVSGAGFDSMIASYVLDASRSSHSLDALALALLNHTNISIKSLIGSGPQQRTFDTVDLASATAYAAEDADVALQLRQAMLPDLQATGLIKLFDELEMPIVEVLAELEWNGICVDAAELDRQRGRLMTRIDELKEQMADETHTKLGRVVNPDSPKQLALALFGKPTDVEPGFGIKPIKKTQTGYSTDVEVLEKLAEDPAITTPLPGLVVEYRQLSKLVSTYLVALKEAINPQTRRVHASFNQTVASTGRLSSSDPNLQNIPIRTDLGREIRRAFHADAGCTLISCDYSQIELRLLAHLSQDPALIEAFLQDQDIHQAVAAQIHRVPLAEVTKAQRNGAKMVNFGIVYGITGFGLGRRLGIPTGEAEAIITQYKKRFAGITTFLEECTQQARQNGYVETMMKRRRPIIDIESNVPSRRALAERTAINSVVQGSAADLIKLAMVKLHEVFAGQAWCDARGERQVKALLQIHDELVFEAPLGRAEDARRIIVSEMERAMSLRVPLKADSSIAANWFDGK